MTHKLVRKLIDQINAAVCERDAVVAQASSDIEVEDAEYGLFVTMVECAKDYATILMQSASDIDHASRARFEEAFLKANCAYGTHISVDD